MTNKKQTGVFCLEVFEDGSFILTKGEDKYAGKNFRKDIGVAVAMLI